MNKSILLIPTAALLLTLGASNAFAAANNYGGSQCQPIYGGGESCPKVPQFEINKTVQNPKTQAFVDNLGVGDAKFAPTQLVPFKLTVKNTTDEKISNVIIKDIFPGVVDFAGGIGDFDANSKTLTIKLESLEANETRDFYVQAKVAAKDKLPADQAVMCVINQSTITIGDKTAQDNAQFCIEKTLTPPANPVNPANPPTTKGGQPVTPGTTTTTTSVANPPTTKGGKPVFPPTTAKKTPETGPEAIALFGLIPSALSGLYLRRKSK